MYLSQGLKLDMSWSKTHALPTTPNGIETPGDPALAVLAWEELAAFSTCGSSVEEV